MPGVWFEACMRSEKDTSIRILTVANVSAADSGSRLVSWPLSPLWQEAGSFWVLQSCSPRGWGRDSCLIRCTRSWERRKEESDIHWKPHEAASASRMQWPELEFCQDSGINFPSAGQNGPGFLFLFVFHYNCTATQTSPKTMRATESFSLAGAGYHLSATQLADLILPKCTTESLITHFPTNVNGRVA